MSTHASDTRRKKPATLLSATSPRSVWALAWPVTLAMLSESLVGLVDMLMVAKLGATAVAAVGTGGQILGAAMVTMTAVGTGTMALVARHVGAGEHDEAEHVHGQSIVVAFLGSIAVITPIIFFATGIVNLFGVEPSVATMGADYTRVVMLSIPLAATLFVVGAAQRAAGDTRTPLWIGVIVNLVNVFLNWVLIFGNLGAPALGVAGSAIATTIAFGCGATIAITLGILQRLRISLHLRDLRLQFTTIRRVLWIGYPAAVEQAMMQVGFLVYLVFAVRYGTEAVAAYFIGVRILALSFLPGFGFGAAASALVGQNLGARRPEEAASAGWIATGMSVAMMSASGVAIAFFAKEVASLFVDDPVVISNTVWFIYMLGISQPFMAIDFTLGGALRGAGDTRFPLLTVLIAFYAGRLGLSALVVFVFDLGLAWLWATLIADYIIRSLLKIWRFRQGSWATIRV
ncbi:MAG: MATE family efflux transporter [Deltaproteobacteria bacterium]